MIPCVVVSFTSCPLLTCTLLLWVLGSPETRVTLGHTLGIGKTHVRLHVWNPQFGCFTWKRAGRVPLLLFVGQIYLFYILFDVYYSYSLTFGTYHDMTFFRASEGFFAITPTGSIAAKVDCDVIFYCNNRHWTEVQMSRQTLKHLG